MFPLLANIVSKLNKFNELNLIHKIIIINGIYDILCGLSILHIINISILDKLHVNMFIKKFSEQEKRLLAYWIITYGCFRLFNSYNYILNKSLVSLTFMIEALVMCNECFIHNTLYKVNTIIVIILSIILGILVLL